MCATCLAVHVRKAYAWSSCCASTLGHAVHAAAAPTLQRSWKSLHDFSICTKLLLYILLKFSCLLQRSFSLMRPFLMLHPSCDHGFSFPLGALSSAMLFDFFSPDSSLTLVTCGRLSAAFICSSGFETFLLVDPHPLLRFSAAQEPHELRYAPALWLAAATFARA